MSHVVKIKKLLKIYNTCGLYMLWYFCLMIIGSDSLAQTMNSSAVENPSMEFISVPPYGSNDNLFGRVHNVDPNSHKVAVYIFIEGAGWWTKPTFAQPLTSIQPDSTWVVDITTGGSDIYATRIQAFLLPDGINPPLAGGLSCLPDTLNAIAIADADTMRSLPSVHFSGYDWWLKASVGSVGPGPNFFSDSTENVRVDTNDDLHLKITQRNGIWYCPEVILTESLGPGRYVFQLTGQVGQINENAVLGLFTWDNDGCNQNFREIDIEFSRWGNVQDSTNAQYVVQPWNVAGNLQRWYVPVLMDSSTHSFGWYSDSINFLSVKGHQSVQPYDSIIYSWQYTGSNIPSPGSETVRMNLWLFNGQPPSNGQEVEVVISKFEFIPHSPLSIKEENPEKIDRYFLSQNFPNPFNSSTIIRYTVPVENQVTIKVFNLLGKEVFVLVNKRHLTGEYEMEWQAKNFPSGIYFYQLVSDQIVLSGKMLLIK